MPLYEITPDAFRPLEEASFTDLKLRERNEEIGTAFEAPLSWERLDAKRASRIKHIVELGGYRSPEAQWPAIHADMVTKMSELEAALSPVLAALEL